MRNNKIFLLIILSSIVFWSCKPNETNSDETSSAVIDLKDILQRDTLRVGIMFGPTSYFLYRDEYMGYDYELAQSLANKLGVKLKIIEAPSRFKLEHMLQERSIDILASNIVESNELKKLFNFVLPQSESYLVLIQNLNVNSLTDVTELKNKKVYVKPNTIYKKRIESLNREIGGTIEIVEAADSLSNEDLIEMVAENKINYTVAYHDIAMLYKSFYKKLDVRMPIGFEQRNGWLLRRESKSLQEFINAWDYTPETQLLQANLTEKYWEKNLFFAQKKIRIPKGAISPFDEYFKKYAHEINWDWKLVAAVAFHESRFDSTQVSWAGAAGIMQLMPRTAANFGLTRKHFFNAEKNIEAGVQYIKSLNLSFRKVQNKDERIKFILAAYNSGPAHVLDAMALAEKYGKNPQIWYNNVEYFLIKKSEPEFYNDPVVKYGRFGGKQTAQYVVNTLETYEKYSGRR